MEEDDLARVDAMIARLLEEIELLTKECVLWYQVYLEIVNSDKTVTPDEPDDAK